MRGILAALLVLGCGDDTVASPDAPATIDAPRIDAMPDAAIDAPAIDAPMIDAPMIDAPMPDAFTIDGSAACLSVDAGTCTTTAWQIEELEPMGDSPSMTVDCQGTLHVAFVNAQSIGPLYYGHRAVGGTWSHEMVFNSAIDATAIAVDHAGGVHIAFQAVTPDTFEYAYKPAGGTTWTLEAVYGPINIAAGPIVSVALDANDQPHIGLEYFTGSDVYAHAHRENGTWVKDIAESSTTVGTAFSGPRIAVDGTTIKMAYPVNNSSARYAVETAGVWSIVNIQPNPSAVSLALDATGSPHVIYNPSTGLVYATPSSSGSWNTELAATAGQSPGACGTNCGVAYQNSLALDGSGGAHMSFAEYENPGGAQQYLVRYVYRAPTGGYTREYIDGLGAFAGIYNQLALDPAGGVHVVYTYMTTNNGEPHVKHAYRCR
jgi:hypothetical protein